MGALQIIIGGVPQVTSTTAVVYTATNQYNAQLFNAVAAPSPSSTQGAIWNDSTQTRLVLGYGATTASYPSIDANGAINLPNAVANMGNTTYGIGMTTGGIFQIKTNSQNINFILSGISQTATYNFGLNSISKWVNTNVQGLGIPIIPISIATASVSTSQSNLINYTPPATAGRYRINGTISNTSGTNTGNTTITVTYKSAASVAITYLPNFEQSGSATFLTGATGASLDFSFELYFSIDNSATAITLSTTVTGTVASFVSATLEQLA